MVGRDERDGDWMGWDVMFGPPSIPVPCMMEIMMERDEWDGNRMAWGMYCGSVGLGCT